MATKSKQDFVAEGQRSARNGNTRSPGGEYSMPLFGEGTSWQAKAFAQGFSDEVEKIKAESIRIAADIENEADAHKLETVGTKPVLKVVQKVSKRLDPPNSMFHAFTDTPPQIVMQHVNRLCVERAAETDARRRTRLLHAVNRIVDRWNKKATLRRMAERREHVRRFPLVA